MVMGELTQEADVVVIGGGPGGYAAAFRAADLGLDVTMIDVDARPGGVCLFRGCIPSKALLFITELIHDAHHAGEAMGVAFGKPQIELDALRAWKNKVIDKLADGLVTLSKKRGVQLVQARAVFESSDRLRLQGSDIAHIKFRHAILATGSHTVSMPGADFKENGRIMDSTGALTLPDIPESLLVIGGGYVGLELGSVYASLGSRVTTIEMADKLLLGADRDLVEPLIRRVTKLFEAIHLSSGVMAMEEHETGVNVTMKIGLEKVQKTFDRVLVSIGRRPNSQDLGIENTGIKLDERGYVIVDEQQRTGDPRIFAIGDVVGGAMLAHKAMREGKVAAEVIAGQHSAFDVRAIPAVVYTDPQIAWCGLTEEDARKANRAVKISRFPWTASGRAATMDSPEGLTKMIFDPETGRILGVGIVGRGAGEMIAEGVLAVEMGALAEDLALSIHPHPTLSETEGEVAEAFLGSATHIFTHRK
jgi:dihydrolipoamide dehydrogenase